MESALLNPRMASRALSPPVRAVLRQIRRSASEPLTLCRIAREISRQPDYLGSLFHRETLRTFHQRLTTIRLRRPARLIRAGEKIEAVAMLVGYQSKRNFYNRFKDTYGVTPGEYRERAHRGERILPRA